MDFATQCNGRRSREKDPYSLNKVIVASFIHGDLDL
jgi:hypothetical protein